MHSGRERSIIVFRITGSQNGALQVRQALNASVKRFGVLVSEHIQKSQIEYVRAAQVWQTERR